MREVVKGVQGAPRGDHEKIVQVYVLQSQKLNRSTLTCWQSGVCEEGRNISSYFLHIFNKTITTS